MGEEKKAGRWRFNDIRDDEKRGSKFDLLKMLDVLVRNEGKKETELTVGGYELCGIVPFSVRGNNAGAVKQ
ncbi:unnamed protein product [Strongylus vulgaris]|uniref:Uncharacterized protein n=1 Tax=Strongylus vulgaris TaxID=40348 RepID=A0A3P7K1J4_STRVU|nr:unnamed protein product [Strongylus vulgaris]